MSTFSKHHSDFFYRALAAIAMAGSILMVFVADTLPEGLQRGELIVDGSGVVLAALATALVLRTAYGVGFRKASDIATAAQNNAVTA
jgi:hypothetical protein